jgi:hypothetical protein
MKRGGDQIDDGLKAILKFAATRLNTNPPRKVPDDHPTPYKYFISLLKM